jgi:hypothetical protein
LIYVDTSVAVAQLLSATRRPSPSFWDGDLVSSRLLTYEVWTRVHARRLAASHGDAARDLFGCLLLLELAPPVLARALEPFPIPVRSLDALHLASLEFVRSKAGDVALATYDSRMSAAARALGVRTIEP